MAWITLTAALVQNRLTGAELTAFKGAAKAASQDADTILADAVNAITNQVRGHVAGCKSNILGAAGTIPNELEAPALALLRRYLVTRLPGMKALFDELRQTEAADAVILMRDVSRCNFAIVPPAEAAPEQAAGSATELVSSRDRQATQEKMKGL